MSGRAPRIFEPEYYDRLNEIEESHWWAAGMRDAMRGLIAARVGQGLRVLDVGCGTGHLLGYLAQSGVAGTAAGIDLSIHALQYAENRRNGVFALASATRLPFSSASFDLVVCIDTVQHLTPEGADLDAAREIARVLVPGGFAYVRTNSAWGHRAAARSAHYRRYTLPVLSGVLTEAGLCVERATHLNALPGAWGALNELIRRPSPHHHERGLGPGLSIGLLPRHLRWLNTLLRAELRAEAAIVAAGINLPFGHSTAFLARKRKEGQTEK